MRRTREKAPAGPGDALPVVEPHRGALSFRRAGKCFGDTWAVRELSLAVPPGSIVGLIGPSGCGKTTAVRMATGSYRPDEGEVHLFGRGAASLDSRQRGAIGYLPQQPVLFGHLSLRENLNFFASLNGVRLRRRARLRELLELVDLEGHERKKVHEASGGMQRRLALAATLVHRPAVVILDEPTAGIDPILRQRFWDHFRTLRDEGTTMLITTQHVEEATRCDTVALIAHGRVAALGAPEDLRRQAYGGELVEVELPRMATEEMLAPLRSLPGVHDVRAVDERRVRLAVDDAGASLPAVLQELAAVGVDVVHAEPVTTDFDDVFIRLVDAARAVPA